VPNLGFRLNSIRAERYSFDAVPQLNINMNIMFGKPEKKEDGSYIIGFVIKVDCVPPIASIDIKGIVLVTPINVDESRNLEEHFKKNTIPYPLMLAVYSYTLPIIALLSRELGIPPPVQPPVQQQQEKRVGYHL